MVPAEKTVTAIDRGRANTRWRDFVDTDSIIRTQAISERDLSAAIRILAERRRVELRPLAAILAGMGDIAQARWVAWRRKQRLTATTPEDFQEPMDRAIAFADPVLDGSAHDCTWQPSTQSWGK
jgi:hypothetical protein